MVKDMLYYIKLGGAKNSLEAGAIDRILKVNGIRDIETFRNTPVDNFRYFRNIGPSRMIVLNKAMELAKADYNRTNKPKRIFNV